MPPSSPDRASDDALRVEAAEWFARMRGPDAGHHQASFEQWLALHPTHRAAYDRMALRWEQSSLVGHTPSGQARAGLASVRAHRRIPAPIYALAASIAAVALIGLIYALHPGRGSNAGVPSIAAARVLETPIGEIRRVKLEDGSVVTLDTASRVEVAFARAERRLRLVAGRARFEVAHDKARPFVVVAGQGEVVATGTMFDVSLVGDHPAVQLLQGSVEVRGVDAGRGPAARAVAHLRPGQAATLDTIAVKQPAAPSPDERWVSGMLSFNGTPLAQALAEANRYSSRQIRLADPRLGELQVTGGFKAGDPDALAAALSAGFGLQIDRESAGALVLRKAG